MLGRQHNLPAPLSGKLRPQLVSGKDYKSDNQWSKRRYDSMVQTVQSVLLKVKDCPKRIIESERLNW